MIKKKILLIGFGSVGQKHYRVLKTYYKKNFEVYIFSKIIKKKFSEKSISIIKKINPDYFILSTPSNLHYKHLKLICSNFDKKIILCEKPLFLKKENLNIRSNKVYVGYNLRFHPLIIKLKKFFYNKKVDEVNIFCSTNVLNWRKQRKGYTPYSYFQSKSGGVLFDLSHEIDYFIWIFGTILKKKISYTKKTSNKKIQSKNIFYLSGKGKRSKKVTIYLNFTSQVEKRYIKIIQKNKNYFGDLNKNYLKINQKDKKIKRINFNNFRIIDSFKFQIYDVFISKKKKVSCSFKEATKLTQKLVEISS